MRLVMHAFAVVVLVSAPLVALAQPTGQDFSGKDLSGRDFTGQRLENANFEDAILKQARFSQAILTGASFHDADLTNTGFLSADLTRADLRGATIAFPFFEQTIFNEANLQGQDLSKVMFFHCKLRGANLRALKQIGSVDDCDFYNADFRGANLTGMKLGTTPCNFRKARYDSRTLWPRDFDPQSVGAVQVEDAPAEPKPNNPPQSNNTNPQGSSAQDIAALIGRKPQAGPPMPNVNQPPVSPVTPQPNTPAPIAPIAVERGDVQLSGLYMQVRYWSFGGNSSLEYVHYCFFPSGYVFVGVPPGGTVNTPLGDADFAAMQRAAPGSCGSYTIRGSQITIQLPGKPAQKMSFAFEKPGDPSVVLLDTLGAIKVGSFKQPQSLAATYEAGATAQSTSGPGPKTFVSAARTIAFRADGSFTTESAAGFNTEGSGSEISGGGSGGTTGQYRLGGNTMTMTSADGTPKTATAFPFPDGDEFPPAHMSIDGVMFKLITP